MPAFGSCAGMILLADAARPSAASGQQTSAAIDMTVRRNAFGRQVDSFESGPGRSAAPCGGPPYAVFIRAPVGRGRSGPEVEVLATESRHAVGSSPSARAPALATAFHPELTGDGRMHESFCQHGEGVAIMSGHSKWATTKHKKAVVDARRGKLFAKLIKNVEVAARSGGPDPAATPRSTTRSQKAKRNSVPNDNIDRAVRRGPAWRPAAPTTSRSPTRATGPVGWRCWSSA